MGIRLRYLSNESAGPNVSRDLKHTSSILHHEVLLPRSSQMYGLGLSNGVCDRDGSRVESHDLRLESNRQRATASRSQACTAIISFRVVSSDRIACEVYGC